MKKTFFFLALTFIFMASCNEDLFTEDLDSQSKLNLLEKTSDPFLNGKAITRDLKINSSIGTTTMSQSEDCINSYLVTIEGTGQATFMGNYKLYMTMCVDAEGNAVSECLGTITAANGDKYYTRLIKTVHGENDYFEGTFLITGGTGKFTGASGEFITIGKFLVQYPTGYFDVVGEGWIKF